MNNFLPEKSWCDWRSRYGRNTGWENRRKSGTRRRAIFSRSGRRSSRRAHVAGTVTCCSRGVLKLNIGAADHLTIVFHVGEPVRRPSGGVGAEVRSDDGEGPRSARTGAVLLCGRTQPSAHFPATRRRRFINNTKTIL